MIDIEKQAEEYADGHKHILYNDCIVIDNDYSRQKQAFQDGAKWGYEKGYEDCRHYAHDYYKPKWHDLRKNPYDLPKEAGEYWCKRSDGTYCTEYYSTALYSKVGVFCVFVVAWCELPTYKEE